MKNIFFCILILHIAHLAFSQQKPVWHRVDQIPATAIFSVQSIDGELVATSADRVYMGRDSAKSWEKSPVLHPLPEGIEHVYKFKGKLYAAAFQQGIFASEDGGITWQFAGNGMSSKYPVKFADRNGILYVATNDSGVFRLNETGTRWEGFNDGLYQGTTYSFESFVNTKDCLLGGVNANGALVALYDNAAAWTTLYYKGGYATDVMTFDLLQAGQNIWAFTSNRAFTTDNGGKTWIQVAAGMRAGYSCRGLQVGDTLYASVVHGGNNTIIYKRGLQEPLTNPWTTVDTLSGNSCFGMAHLGRRLYVATFNGLYFTEVSDKPGIPDERDELENFLVYPNPANDYLIIANGFTRTVSQFQIYTLMGKKKLSVKIADDEQRLDISHLPSGYYFYILSTSSGKTRRGTFLIYR